MDIAAITGAYSSLKAIKKIGSSLLDAKIDHETKKCQTLLIESAVFKRTFSMFVKNL